MIHGDLRGVSCQLCLDVFRRSFTTQNNIFISDNGHALIADFGVSKFYEDESIPGSLAPNGSAYRWMAPELMSSDVALNTERTTASDIYAYGCTVLEASLSLASVHSL